MNGHSFDVCFSSEFDAECDPTLKYSKMWQEIESAGSHARVVAGKPPFSRKQLGRGSTLETKIVKRSFHHGPVKPGRVTDIQPLFAGLSQQHAHWFRQLRRLQSFVNFRKVHQTDTPTGHGVALWSSIIRAKGFDDTFVQWWKQHSSRVFGAPNHLPMDPPEFVAQKIYESFLIDVRKLERSLKSQINTHTKDKRQELAHLIFKDIRRTAPDRVDVLLNTQQGQVVQVDSVSNSFLVSEHCKLSLQHPVFVNGVQLSVIHIVQNQLWVTDLAGVQVGHAVRQTKFTGAAEEMFQAFGEEWSRRWDRHREVPLSQWEQICNFGRQFFQRSEIQLPAWNADMLRQEIARKKLRSATGLDGVSLTDLKAMPVRVLQAHCDIYSEAESRGVWPHQALVGKVASLAKTSSPTDVSSYRPITVLPHCYRLWSGVRSKALLAIIGERSPAFLFGNKPHCQSSFIWTHLAWMVEDAYIGETAVAGIVADIEKAFNHLPREVVFQMGVIFGIPFATLQAWASAMGGLERRFQIRDNLGPPVPSCTGFPEGCAMLGDAFDRLFVPQVVRIAVPTVSTSELCGRSAASHN